MGPLKSALAGPPGVLALITSSWFFDEVVRHSPTAHPTAYRPVRVRVKETNTVGWVHLPDHPYPPRDTTLKDPLPGGLTTPVPHQLPAGTSHFVGRAEDLDPYAAAALIHTSVNQAQHFLDLLARAHLVQPASPGRYGMHDLLRAYATYLATIEDSEAERWAALTRLFDHYLATAAAAMDALVPTEQHRRPRIPPSATPSMAEPIAARPWLDAERPTLVAVCAYTATHGWPGHTIRLATTLVRYLDLGGHYSDAVAVHTDALLATRRIGDLASTTGKVKPALWET